jgi:hypothetical protein
MEVNLVLFIVQLVGGALLMVFMNHLADEFDSLLFYAHEVAVLAGVE